MFVAHLIQEKGLQSSCSICESREFIADMFSRRDMTPNATNCNYLQEILLQTIIYTCLENIVYHFLGNCGWF